MSMGDETTNAPRGAQRGEQYPPGSFACEQCAGVVVYHAQVDKWRCRGCSVEHPGDYKPPVWHRKPSSRFDGTPDIGADVPGGGAV